MSHPTSDKARFWKNRGVNRTKRPLRNIKYEIIVKEFGEPGTFNDSVNYEKYKFKDLGYLILCWGSDRSSTTLRKESLNFHGPITVKELKEIIGEKQYSKFCQGKRIFIVQRRVNGVNIKNEQSNNSDTSILG